jgi:hypothetical protein
MADQRLFHDFAAGGVLQVIGAELVVIDLDILIVDAGAVQWATGWPSSSSRRYSDTLTSPCAQALRSRVSVSRPPASWRNASG